MNVISDDAARPVGRRALQVGHPSSVNILSDDERPSPGGVNLARATRIADARSAPNQGFALAPSTGRRVVATRTVGLAEICDASTRAPLAPNPLASRLAQPPSASTHAPAGTCSNTARREMPPDGSELFTPTPIQVKADGRSWTTGRSRQERGARGASQHR